MLGVFNEYWKDDEGISLHQMVAGQSERQIFLFFCTRQQGRSASAISQLEERSEAHRDGKNLEGILVLALCRIDEGYAGTPLAQYF